MGAPGPLASKVRFCYKSILDPGGCSSCCVFAMLDAYSCINSMLDVRSCVFAILELTSVKLGVHGCVIAMCAGSCTKAISVCIRNI